MVLDTLMLSRIQFAFTISFHIIFPAFSIGLATFLAIMEGAWLKTKNPAYLKICKFWMKIFALTFGMGVVSGVVMEFQFGTNWAGYAREVGPVLGGLFTYEVLTAFFVEAGFLGVMIFGWDKVGPRLHYIATLLVVFGVNLSAFWILSANSWMQTPDGAVLQNGHFVVTSWYNVIFNYSAIPRWIHMTLAAYITTGFVIAAISAHYLLKNQHLEIAKKCLSFVMWALLILVPLQMYVGDDVGLHVHKYQPLKTAAMEGVWNTQNGAPLLLFAIPDQAAQKNLLAVGIPHLAALINTHEWNGKLIGLKTVSPANQPDVFITFWAFRIMVFMGIIMLAMAFYAAYLRARKRLYDNKFFLKACLYSAPIGFIAIITGWFTAEVGRQPWVVYDMLRTSNAVSHIPVANVITSLVLIIVVYGVIFGIFYFKYLFKIIHAGPDDQTIEAQPFGYLADDMGGEK